MRASAHAIVGATRPASLHVPRCMCAQESRLSSFSRRGRPEALLCDT